MSHDFKKFPELRDDQLPIYYFDSPHKQIFESFKAKVIKVTDGDTIRVECEFRDFSFPIRFLRTAAPELKEKGGKEAKNWLESQILGKDVDIIIDKDKRVGKWGRLLGEVFIHGMSMNEQSMSQGFAIDFSSRERQQIPNFSRELGGYLK